MNELLALLGFQERQSRSEKGKYRENRREKGEHEVKQDRSERAARLAEWIARRGGQVTVREVVMNGVAGVKNVREAHELLHFLVSQGRGRFETVRSGRTNQQKKLFVLLPEREV